MKRYRCTVAYCGAAYSGWQSQRNGTSVQEQIESVLHDIAHAKINIIASGRTDAGVNASAQVFHFDTELEMTPRKWMGAINGHLPKDIHIMDVQETDHLFHARYCVRRKQYDYRINLGPYDVFTRDTAYQCPVKLDVEKMKEASKYLIGTHDFTSFNSNTLAETPNQVRTVYDIVFTREGNILKLSFHGKGFLRYMVRMMAAQLVEVGRGRLQPEDIQKMLEARSKTIARKNAPANGLTLEKVEYFEICALNEEVMIREFLADDDLPEGHTIDSLERDVSESKWPRLYVMTYRTSQQQLGIMSAISPEEGCLVEVYTETDFKRAEDLHAQLQEWLIKNGASQSAEVKIVLKQEK
ncbi:MAG: tRNA pseudouridine(38-40) synthase TruA [Solobacterium sp.]|nr:tRNA pseudouridine(38-40) synthase TruA [Solobacterium sp.]